MHIASVTKLELGCAGQSLHVLFLYSAFAACTWDGSLIKLSWLRRGLARCFLYSIPSVCHSLETVLVA